MGRVIGEFLKKLTLIHVPPAVEPALPELVGQLFQRAQIPGLTGHQRVIVRTKGLDKGIILRVFVLRKMPVNEQALKVAVSRSAGVQGIVGALGKCVDAPDAGVDLDQPFLFELTGLIRKPYIVFRPLVLTQVGVAGAVAEMDGAAPGKPEELVHAPVLRHPRKHLHQRGNMVVEELLIGSSGDQHLDSRIAQAQQHRLPADKPAFASAPGPAVAHIAVPFRQGQGLLFVGGGHGQHLSRHNRRTLLPWSPESVPGCPPGSAPAEAGRSGPAAPGYPPRTAVPKSPSDPSAPR